MAHTNEDHIKLVNGLVEITIDSADGYEEAAKDAQSSRFKTLFQARAQERRGIVSDLQAEVRRLGGTPDDDGSILAIERHVFDARGIGASEMFKLPMRASSIYVTDRFVERVQNAGLRGVAFEMVWNSAIS